MDNIRLGTIGSGQIVHSILDAVAQTENICLEAVYSRTEEKGRELAKAYGAEKVYTDLDAMLKDEAVNFVYVASPNNLHYEYSKKALLAGKNVLCEKPFCTRYEQAQELFEIADEKGLYLIEMVPTGFLPNFPVLKEAVSKIGRVKLVIGNYTQYSARYDKLLAGEKPNVFNAEFAGGCLMDINYYNVYLTLALFGEPKRGEYYPNMFDGVDTSGNMVMAYDGFVATLAGAKDCRGDSFYQIEGEKGFINVIGGSNGLSEIRVVAEGKDEIINLQPNPDRWFYEIQQLVPMILSGDKAAFEKNRQLALMQTALIESSRKAAGIVYPGDK